MGNVSVRPMAWEIVTNNNEDEDAIIIDFVDLNSEYPLVRINQDNKYISFTFDELKELKKLIPELEKILKENGID